ncbi:MAG: extracellular solute-binding protein [Rubellimicrobium sp.]|nr:extracellular solute-binding protein [Rubellimicrobium sp.]
MHLKSWALAAAMAIISGPGFAACAFENTVPVSSLSAAFEAWKAVTDAMAECGNVTAALDQEFEAKQPEAFAANPSLYQIGGVSNGSITPLLQQGLIRPLDDLVAAYGQNLAPNQLISIDGHVMAIAMMVNTQHLMFRQDVLDQVGLPVPTTWEEVLTAAEAIRAAGIMEYPLGATMRSGWNLAQDFNNMFLGFGGAFTNPDGTPAVNSEAGLAALDMMQRLTAYMDPEYLAADSTVVQQQFQQGRIAMANLWASRGGALDDEAESQVVGLVNAAAAPMAVAGGPPATTLWWDGIVIAANITDAEAEAAFRVAMEGLDSEMVTANNDDAIWLIPGYTPSRLAGGAIATATANVAPAAYPSTVEMGLMHSALGNQLPAFFTGAATAEAVLAATEAEYVAAATEAGILQ